MACEPSRAPPSACSSMRAPGMTAAADQAIAGDRHATYTVEGRSVVVHERLTFDPVAVDGIRSVSLVVPELADRPLDVTIEGADATVLRIDTSGVAEWRSFWSEIPAVHQIEVPAAPTIAARTRSPGRA